MCGRAERPRMKNGWVGASPPCPSVCLCSGGVVLRRPLPYSSNDPLLCTFGSLIYQPLRHRQRLGDAKNIKKSSGRSEIIGGTAVKILPNENKKTRGHKGGKSEWGNLARSTVANAAGVSASPSFSLIQLVYCASAEYRRRWADTFK